ncbi:MAG TPA: hypothetical protein DCM68_06035, partial [Verrucomicrobia bacterium]|nr:hypothetical protein [Verrucomicrobiota bacterium]
QHDPNLHPIADAPRQGRMEVAEDGSLRVGRALPPCVAGEPTFASSDARSLGGHIHQSDARFQAIHLSTGRFRRDTVGFSL